MNFNTEQKVFILKLVFKQYIDSSLPAWIDDDDYGLNHLVDEIELVDLFDFISEAYLTHDESVTGFYAFFQGACYAKAKNNG